VLYCDVAVANPEALDTLAVAVFHLRRAGIEAAVPNFLLPKDLSEHLHYALAPLCTDRPPQAGDGFALFGAHLMSGDKLAQLHSLSFPKGMQSYAFGKFETDQADIQTKARLSYVFGCDPQIHLISDQVAGLAPLFGTGATPVACDKVRLLLISPDLDDVATQREIFSLKSRNNLKLSILTRGASKQDWIKRFGMEIPAYHFSEVMPALMAQQFDVCAVCTPLSDNYRVSMLLAALGAVGAPLLDCTLGHEMSRTAEKYVPAPPNVAAIADFLKQEILPKRQEIADLTRAASVTMFDPLTTFASYIKQSTVTQRQKARQNTVIFMPTNGVGLGHAQRCSLIAQDLYDYKIDAKFAAFPSCIRKIKDAGFDVMPLISRAEVKTSKFAFDLHNYARIQALTEDAGGFVFDGGYVFNSVYNTILDKRLRSVWIRRGLWQATQNNTAALDREKAFTGVIVPTEAFAELNSDYSRGPHVHKVGPIVDQVKLTADQRGKLREDLCARFERPFNRLVVTMLGGGVAADRRAQIQSICAEMERRHDVLHLVVVWPTATVDPAWFLWKNTKIVKTHRASMVAAASDLFLSAVGYNSFHEMLYNQVPTIFMGQMSAFMDDQVLRAKAAVDRGLAELVAETELKNLSQRIAWFLDHGGSQIMRDRLNAFELPQPGNSAAAALIKEICFG
jgi:hypothetical protein